MNVYLNEYYSTFNLFVSCEGTHISDFRKDG